MGCDRLARGLAPLLTLGAASRTLRLLGKEVPKKRRKRRLMHRPRSGVGAGQQSRCSNRGHLRSRGCADMYKGKHDRERTAEKCGPKLSGQITTSLSRDWLSACRTASRVLVPAGVAGVLPIGVAEDESIVALMALTPLVGVHARHQGESRGAITSQ